MGIKLNLLNGINDGYLRFVEDWNKAFDSIKWCPPAYMEDDWEVLEKYLKDNLKNTLGFDFDETEKLKYEINNYKQNYTLKEVDFRNFIVDYEVENEPTKSILKVKLKGEDIELIGKIFFDDRIEYGANELIKKTIGVEFI